MTAIFDDTFTGTGDLSTHVPDVGAGWVRLSGATLAESVLDGAGNCYVPSSASANAAIHPSIAGGLDRAPDDYVLEITFNNDGTVDNYGLEIEGVYSIGFDSWHISVYPHPTVTVFGAPHSTPFAHVWVGNGEATSIDVSALSGVNDVIRVVRVAGSPGTAALYLNDVLLASGPCDGGTYIGDSIVVNPFDLGAGAPFPLSLSRVLIDGAASQFWKDFVKTLETI